MGTGEEKMPFKPSKPTSSAQVSYFRFKQVHGYTQSVSQTIRLNNLCVFDDVYTSYLQEVPPTPYPDWSNSMQVCVIGTTLAAILFS